MTGHTWVCWIPGVRWVSLQRVAFFWVLISDAQTGNIKVCRRGHTCCLRLCHHNSRSEEAAKRRIQEGRGNVAAPPSLGCTTPLQPLVWLSRVGVFISSCKIVFLLFYHAPQCAILSYHCVWHTRACLSIASQIEHFVSWLLYRGIFRDFTKILFSKCCWPSSQSESIVPT